MGCSIALRVDGEWSAGLSAWLEKNQLSGLACREVLQDGSNPHVHLLLTCQKDLKLPALRKSLLNACPELRGNGAYSMTTVRDEAKYVRYICKGASEHEMPVIVWQQYMCDVEEMHDEYWRENKKKYKPSLSVTEYVLQKCKDNGVGCEDRSKIAEFYVAEQVARGKCLNLFQIKGQVNLIQCMLDGSGKKIADFAAEI